MTALSPTQTDSTRDSNRSPSEFVQSLLEESREVTAVERFAKKHDAGDLPDQSRYYRDLLPLTAPGDGQQYAFDVDLDACSGCKACVSACHHLNGLETSETWRSVGLLHGENDLPLLQHVTTACHHCVDPGCLSGCPTNAYEKDPATGIVRHLDDQCFGCQYCTMACPYEVPQYSPSKGIVRKCDMCYGRLAEGEAPACVQSCPNGAIRIAVIDVADSVARTTAGDFLPASPPSQLTNPTTVYRSGRHLPSNLKAGDAGHVVPQHAHLPLVVMLVLTQLSVGGLAFGVLSRLLEGGVAAEATIVAATLAGLAGLGVAPLHLGRPHLAFRSVLGWRHSWLSREAIVFGLYAPLAMAVSAYAILPIIRPMVIEKLPALVDSVLAVILPAAIRPGLEVAAIVSGILGVYCSAKIYQFTGREFWLGFRTYAKFYGAAAISGLSLTLAMATMFGVSNDTLQALVAAVLSLSIAKLGYEAAVFRPDMASSDPLRGTRQLMLGALRLTTKFRFAFGLVGGVVLPVAMLLLGNSTLAAVLAVASSACVLIGELGERSLYFGAVVPLKMPGGVKS